MPAFVGASEQPVLATDGNTAQRAFGGVVVDLEAPDPVPEIPPVRTRDPALHRPGLTPADEANSAGVMNPRDV